MTARTVVRLFAAMTALISTAAAAQEPYAYPSRGQGPKQQERDRYQCHNWAVGQTGFDPAHATAPPPARGGALRGAVGGGAIGAVGGAIGGDAGKGAAIGATTGALLGGIRQARRNNAAAAQQSQGVAAYDRALATCLRGRGYTVN